LWGGAPISKTADTTKSRGKSIKQGTKTVLGSRGLDKHVKERGGVLISKTRKYTRKGITWNFRGVERKEDGGDTVGGRNGKGRKGTRFTHSSRGCGTATLLGGGIHVTEKRLPEEGKPLKRRKGQAARKDTE